MFNERISCRYCCRTNAIKKHGTAPSGAPRYLCAHCQRTFQKKYIYQAYKDSDESVVKKMKKDLDS
ncbi:IS1/IS1595 family N-terminal zinc-binding domain-containing protein [Limnobaculum allomyrinae]